jgi:hypothetical protein
MVGMVKTIATQLSAIYLVQRGAHTEPRIDTPAKIRHELAKISSTIEEYRSGFWQQDIAIVPGMREESTERVDAVSRLHEIVPSI